MRIEWRKVKDELLKVQETLDEKEKVQSEFEKNLEEAKKTASSARELCREMQLTKVQITTTFCQYFDNNFLFPGRTGHVSTSQIIFGIGIGKS